MAEGWSWRVLTEPWEIWILTDADTEDITEDTATEVTSPTMEAMEAMEAMEVIREVIREVISSPRPPSSSKPPPSSQLVEQLVSLASWASEL